MPQQAKVGSLEAIEAFRSNLIVYISQARPALEEISGDATRTRMWLEDDRRQYWEAQIRRRSKVLEEAKQALFTGRISMLGKESAAQQMEVHRAKKALDEAEDKLRVVKKWRREFDGRVQPLVKQMEKLHTVLTQDLVQAVAFLTKVENVLAAYADKAPASATPVAAGPAPGAGAAAASALTGEAGSKTPEAP